NSNQMKSASMPQRPRRITYRTQVHQSELCPVSANEPSERFGDVPEDAIVTAGSILDGMLGSIRAATTRNYLNMPALPSSEQSYRKLIHLPISPTSPIHPLADLRKARFAGSLEVREKS